MSDIILRIKRKRDEIPAEIIRIETKKIKSLSIDNMLSDLSIDSKQLVFRLQKDSYEKRAENYLKQGSHEKVMQNIQSNYVANHREKAKLQRLEKVTHFRIDRVIEGEMSADQIYCNGKPLKTISLGFSDATEADEYDTYKIEAVSDEHRDHAEGVLYLDSEGESQDSHELTDSEDSNREDHPYNEYPEEEESDNSSEYNSRSSAEYEYEEVEY